LKNEMMLPAVLDPHQSASHSSRVIPA